jgi:hypothetical protein
VKRALATLCTCATVLLGLLCVAAAARADDPPTERSVIEPATRPITVSLEVVSAGQRIGDVDFSVFAGPLAGPPIERMTSRADALVSKTLNVRPGANALTLMPIPKNVFTGEQDWSRDGMAKQRAAALRAFGAWAFKSQYTEPILPDQSEYRVTITVEPAVTVRGRGVRFGEPLAHVSAQSNEVPGVMFTSSRPEAGGFSFGCVPKNRPFPFFLSVGQRLHRFVVPPTEVDIDLGDLECPDYPREGRLALTITPSDDDPEWLRGKFLTFVRDDGEMTLMFGLRFNQIRESELLTPSDGVLRLVGGVEDAVMLPAGTYFVVPTSHFRHAHLAAVEDAIARRPFSIPGLTTVTISKGKTTKVDLGKIPLSDLSADRDR